MAALQETTTRVYRWSRRHPAWVALLLIFFLYFLTRLIRLHAVPIFIDEAIYLKWARDARAGNVWVSLLWDGKPPLHAWFMVPFISVFRDPLTAGRVASVFCGAFTTLGMFLIGKELKDEWLGVLAAFLYVICPYALWFDRLALAESLLLALFTFSIYFAVRAARSGELLYLFWTGFFLGLALLVKGTAQLLYLIVPFAYLVPRRSRDSSGKRKPLLKWLLGVGLSLLLGFGMLNLIRLSPVYGERSTFILERTRSISEVFSNPFANVLRFAGSIFYSLFIYLTPVLLVLAIAGFILAIWKRWRPGYFLIVWFVISFAIITLVGKFTWPRFYLVLVPPALLGGAYAIFLCYQLTVKKLKQKPWEGRSPGYRAVVVSVIALFLLAILVPAGFELRGMIRAETGIECFLTGLNAGVDMKSVVGFLEEESKDKPITVGVDHYFTELIIELYLGDDPDVEVVSYDRRFKKGCGEFPAELAESAEEEPAFFIFNRLDEIPGDWPLVILSEFRSYEDPDEVSLYIAEVLPSRK